MCSTKASLPYRAYVILTAVQEKSLDYARDDDGAKRYQNSAALRETLILRLNQRFPRSFDSVLLFSDKPFFNIRRFSPLRMTKCAAPTPLNP